MIVKNQQFKKDIVGVWEEQIYSNVERVYRIKDKEDNEFIQLKIKGQELLELIPVTYTDKKMNDEGKTIEKLV